MYKYLTIRSILCLTAKRNQLFAKSLPKTRETECKNIDPSTIFVSKQEFVRKIRCLVTRLSTRWWTHERRKSVSFYHACSFTYLFIYFLFEQSLHFLQFLPIYSLLSYKIRIFLEEELERGFSALINQKFGNL